MKYISKAYVFALLVTLNMPALSFPAFAQDVEFAWAAGMGGTGYDYGYGIAVDASGNVYTTGSFEGTADFDPGSGVSNLTSAGDNDVFVRKLDASGNFLWARSMGGTGSDRAWGIAVDASGSVYTTGYFRNTADFDPGAGVFNLTSAGSTGVFVQKLDTDGNFLWVKQMGGTSSDYGYAIAVDASGNVYTTGSFRDTVDFDPGSGVSNLTSAGDNDVFVSKLDASGNFLWARSMGGTGSDRAWGIAVDASGSVYTTGYFRNTADFDPGAEVSNLTSAGDNDVFVSKLDASGNFLWARSMGGTGSDRGGGIAVDASGIVYTTGWFSSTVDFDPGAGTVNLTSAGARDIFVQKLSPPALDMPTATCFSFR
jgi:ribosomal protein S11